MFQVWIVCFGWYLTILGASAEGNTSTSSGSILEKQHDYKLKFERGEIVRYDKRYIKSIDIRTFKYNRTSAVVNASVTFKRDIGVDVEIICEAYKFASNEYRAFPIRFQYNFCEAVRRNSMGLGNFRRCGTFTGCPIVKDKTYSICNWSPDPAKFPPLIPSGQYMLECQAVHGSVEIFLDRGYGTISRPIPIPE